MPVPYTFGTATAAIPLSQLDSNFATAITIGNTAVQLGNTVTTLNNMTLANVTISSGNVTITNVSVTTANVSGTANISTLAVVGNETIGGNSTISGNASVTGNVTASINVSAAKLIPTGSSATGNGLYLPAANALGLSTNGTNALYIDSSQNVGIGTSSPDIYSQGGKMFTVSNTATNSYAWATLAGSGTGGGEIDLGNQTIRHAAIASLSGSALAFYTNTTNTGTGVSEKMRIDSSGNLLVGTTATTSNARLAVTTSSTSILDFGIYAKNSGGAFLLGIDNNGGFSTGTAAGSPYNATTATAANTVVDSAGALKRSTSSIKYKTDVRDATHGLVDLLKLRSVTYKGKNDGDTIFGGLIAEEVDAAGLTEFVQYADDGTPDALAYGNMVSLCIKAIQEQQALIQQLQADIATLKGQK